MNREDRKFAEMTYSHFIEAVTSIGDDIKPSPGGDDIIKYGLERLKKDTKSPSIFLGYALMWIGFNSGADFGLDLGEVLFGK